MTDTEKDTYTVQAGCKNCGWSGSVTIEKGYTFDARYSSGSRETCPTCGCNTLRQQHRPTPGGRA